MTSRPAKCVSRTASASASPNWASAWTAVGQRQEPDTAPPFKAAASNRPLSQLIPKILFAMSAAFARSGLRTFQTRGRNSTHALQVVHRQNPVKVKLAHHLYCISENLPQRKLEDLGSAERLVVNDYFVDQAVEILAIDGEIAPNHKRTSIASVCYRCECPRRHLQPINIKEHVRSVAYSSYVMPGAGPVWIRKRQYLRSGRNP